MAKPLLGVNYWRNQFAVTDGDLNRLAAILRDANGPIQVGDLLRGIVEYKLAQDSLVFDPLERAKSALAAGKLLGEATIYHPTGVYKLGQQLYVARRFTGGEWQIGCGTVVNIDRSQRWSTIELEVPDEPQHWFFVCEVPSGHEYAVKHLTPLSGSEQTADDVLDSFSGELLPHLHGRLAVDPRFVSLGNWWWLADAVQPLPPEALSILHKFLLTAAEPLAIGGLLARLGADWPDAPGNRFSLNRALLADPDRFRNIGTAAEPRWQAILPAHVIRLANGTLIDLSMPPDSLWAEHGSLFAGAMPDELRDHPDLVQLLGCWLLRPLLITFDGEDLAIVRAYLEDACEARTDAEILADFGRTPLQDDWLRWRFSLAWALREAGEALGIEFVGAGGVWRWALQVAPMVQPEHHRPIRGRDGLPVEVVTVGVDDIQCDLSLVEPDEPEPEPKPAPDTWTPAATEWTYTLTYYDWQHGILPYAGGARSIIPPLAEGQARALLYAVAPQVSDQEFAITLHGHERTPWLDSRGFLEICQGYYLVPGARIRLLRTESPDRFRLLYTLAAKQTCRVLFFDPESLRPHIQEITFACEVDPDMLLAESRFTDIKALDRLYQVDRRTAPKVLANIFEVIGEHDVAQELYRARFSDLFPLLCVTKPYSRSYVQQILAGSCSFPWFHPDRDRPGDWHVYDPKVVRQRSRATVHGSGKSIPDLGDFPPEVGGTATMPKPEILLPADTADLWAAIQRLAGQRLHTLGEGQPFVVRRVSDQTVYFQVEASGRDYQAGRNQIAKAWVALTQRGHLPQTALRTELDLSHPVYIASILSLMPGVTHTTEPVTLHYAARPDSATGEALSPGGEPGTVQVAEFEQIRQIVRSSLAGQTIHTLTGRPNQITQIDDEGLIVVTETGKAEVLWQWIEEVYNALRSLGTIERKDIREGPFRTRGAFRSAFMFGLLAQLAHIEVRTDPRIALTYHRPEGKIALRDADRPPVPAKAPGAAAPLDAEPEPATPAPVERRRDGQALMPGMPLGPIFDGQPAADPAPVQASPSEPGPSSPPTASASPAGTPPSAAPPSQPPGGPPLAGQPPKPAPRPQAPRGDLSSKRLFSRHYLEHRLADHPEWGEDPRTTFAQVRDLWQTACRYGGTWNEAQTEEEFVKPALKALGWAFTVQPKSTKGGQLTRPDYALFADEKAQKEAQPYHGKEEDAFYSRALAIAEAKYWGRPLSQTDKSGRSTWKADSNPSHQMVSYLVGTRVPWGILTNGRTWRLYSREVSSTASEFYEVDLGLLFDLVADGAEPTPDQLDQFRRWWLFFRREALTPDPHGRSFVQRVHQGSATYAREISDKLKELIFEQVVPEIAGGFVVYRSKQRGIRQETDASLREIYAATLSLLYKLLFLLYAEARGLLPMDNPGYRQQSLTATAEWAARQLDRKLPVSDATHATARYDAMLALFHRVDQGDPSLGIPRYDGGLFAAGSPENRFLEEHKLSDKAVAHAVDILVRDAGQPVDYAYISVRNLGAIYEGLLENKLRVVDAAAGQVELINDKGERKASGSYYTPDYIVEYIVQHTLDPILDERQASFEAAMDRCAGLRRQLADPRHMSGVELLRGRLEEAERDAREAFLGIKVCDPAMGSGHFLVNAVDHLTDGIIQRMQAYHDAHGNVQWDWNPIQQMIDRVRGEIVAEMGRQGIEVDAPRLDDTALLTRLVMKRCIYGVDLNPLAVELAKLSLWLHSFTVGAPLSFLDHHLRWGNSLIGTDVRTVEREIQRTDKGPAVQLGLFAGPFAGLLDLTAVMTGVAGRADATLADVRQSADAFAEFQRQLLPYKQVLDLWVSRHFGNKHAEEFLTLYSDAVLPALRGEKQVGEPYRSAIEQARRLWEEKRFFHWDLEFPEVFVDLRQRDWAKNPGFDAVIGNPPYDELSEVALGREVDEKAYIEATELFREARTYRINLYRLFIACAVSKSRIGGSHSFIVPMSLLGDRFTFDLRRKLVTETEFVSIEAFPQKDDPRDRVFFDAKLPTCIYALRRQAPRVQFRVRTHPGKEILDDSPAYSVTATEIAGFDPENYTIPIVDESSWQLARKLIQNPNLCPIGTVATPMSGEVVFNQTFRPYLSENPEHALVLRGGHVQRYELIDDPKQGTPVYIDKQRWLAASGSETAAYAHLQPRVVYQESAALDNWRRIIAALLPAGNVCGHKICYFVDVRYDLLAFLALFNSRLVEWRFRLVSTTNSLSAYQITPIPIPKVNFITPADERQRHFEKTKRLYEQSDAYASLLDVSAHHLETGRTDVIHDLLAFLAEQMITMNKSKQAQLKAFRLDLGGYLDEAQLGRLNRLYTPPKPPEEGAKSYAQKKAAHEQAAGLAKAQLGPLAGETLDLADFWRLNEAQWRWLVRQRLGEVANMSKLVAVYEQYHRQLAPLMRRLQRTDDLIDRVVYQLYGLTEEEIEIVEGR